MSTNLPDRLTAHFICGGDITNLRDEHDEPVIGYTNGASHERSHALATELCRRYNLHPQLVAALKYFAGKHLPEDFDPELAEGCADLDDMMISRDAIRQARAVLAQARGGVT